MPFAAKEYLCSPNDEVTKFYVYQDDEKEELKKEEAKEVVKKEEAKKEEPHLIQKVDSSGEIKKMEEVKVGENAGEMKMAKVVSIEMDKPVVKEENAGGMQAINAVSVEINKPVAEEGKKVEENKGESKVIESLVLSEAASSVYLKQPKKINTLKKLLEFLDQETFEPVLAGYFIKIMENVIDQRREDILQYFFRDDILRKKILNHFDQKFVEELAFKLIDSIAGSNQQQNDDKGRITKCGDFILDIIKLIPEGRTKEHVMNGCSLVLVLIKKKVQIPFLTSKKVLDSFFDMITGNNEKSEPIYCCLRILTKMNFLKDPREDTESEYHSDMNSSGK
jgi:hypothetical protein